MHNTTALLAPMIRIAVLSLFLMACDTEEPTPIATYTLSTQASPTEGGRITTSPSGSTFTEGQSVSLTPEANANWAFSHWEGAASGSTRPLTLTMDANKSITGIFIKREYPLSITVEGDGTVTEEIVTNPSGREYPHGTTVELTPVPADGWVFESWGGDLSGNEVPKRITVDGEKNVSAKFKIREYPLTITIEGEGTVTEEVVTNPAGRNYPQGTVVELTPVPAEGWVFESWGGDLEGNEAPKRITVDGEKHVTVNFKEASTGLFYLAENGITCKCEGANPGDKGFINGVEYEAVDNSLLRQRRDQRVDMTKLCTSLATDMSRLFLASAFNQPIGNWDVGNVTDMGSMFSSSFFNQPIGHWDVAKVTDMSWMFHNSPFDQLIENWDVGNVKNMMLMFANSKFNKPIGDWNVSEVTNMEQMFQNSLFNQPLGKWDVGNVTNMKEMFHLTSFNHPINSWDVAKVTNMSGMFAGHFTSVNSMQFNQPIGNWDVRSVTDMRSMFSFNFAFNQDLSKWCVTNIPARPVNFRSGTSAWVLPEPIWGTCPE